MNDLPKDFTLLAQDALQDFEQHHKDDASISDAQYDAIRATVLSSLAIAHELRQMRLGAADNSGGRHE
jgi:hypothetical protein